MSTCSLEKLLPDYIKCFEAYVPSKPDSELIKLYGCSRLYRLNNNENPLGPPPAAAQVLQSFPPPRAAVYPSGDAFYLRQKLAEKFNKDPEQFLVGNGANEVISFVIKAFCEQGDNIITADKTFAVYEWVAVFRFEGEAGPSQGLRIRRTGNVGPNRRTHQDSLPVQSKQSYGHLLEHRTAPALSRRNRRPPYSRVDEAYCEFVEADDYPDGCPDRGVSQSVIFRTFSKMDGLAGLRIGYLAGQLPLVDAIRRTCIVYSVNVLAQEAALAAVAEDDHVIRTRHLVREVKAFLREELTRLRLPFISGEGNFVMVKLPMSDTLAYRKLMTQGVMVRTMTGFRFPNHIRITVAKMDASGSALSRLGKILAVDGWVGRAGLKLRPFW
jgi:histidinol-phosphate aminotransferase